MYDFDGKSSSPRSPSPEIANPAISGEGDAALPLRWRTHAMAFIGTPSPKNDGFSFFGEGVEVRSANLRDEDFPRN
jgi:hypothetical protein